MFPLSLQGTYLELAPALVALKSGKSVSHGFDERTHLSDDTVPVVNSAETPGANLSMSSLWRSSSSERKHNQLNVSDNTRV